MSDNSLGQYLKELRKSLNYSQEYVALQLNITRQTYSHYETNRITPPSNSLYNLAKLYGVSVENFLDYVVTYSIPNELSSNNCINKETDSLEDYLTFINIDENTKKYKYLSANERLLIYYYQLLEERDKNDLLKILKIRNDSKSKNE